MSDFLNITAGAMGFAMGYMQADNVTYAGVTVDCVANEKTSDLLAMGGYEQHFAGFVRVPRAGFPDPVKGSKIEVNGTERRITSWDEDPISWKIYLEDVTR
jgi:hypothetical protein